MMRKMMRITVLALERLADNKHGILGRQANRQARKGAKKMRAA